MAQEERPRHPWIRYWARTVDMVIAMLCLAIVLAFVAPDAFAGDDDAWGLFFTSLFFWIFVEAIMLASWGKTPGKALFRIEIIDTHGKHPEFGQALSRSFRVWFFGLGIGFPLVAAITMLVAYNKLMKHGRTSWDQTLGLQVNHQKVSGFRWAVVVVVLLAVFLLNVAAMAKGAF